MSSAVFSNDRMLPTEALKTVLAEPPLPAQVAQQVETQDGARAIEVAALFDETVLEVRHLDNPSGGRLSRLTKGLLGSAGAALLGTFALFADSYLQVAAEKAAESAIKSQPRHTRDSGRTRDAAAGGLLFYGIGALLYGLARAGGERRENEFSIGSAPGATFKLDSDNLPHARFPLVRSTGSDYEFLFTESMSGELSLPGQGASKGTPLSELKLSAAPASDIPGALAMAIPEGARISLRHKDCSFLIRSVPRPRHYPVPLRVDWQAQAYTGVVLAGAAGLIGLMFAVPPDPRSLSLDGFTNEQLMRYLVKAPEVKDEPTPWLQKQQPQPEKSGGRAAQGNRGKIGKQDAPKRNDARYASAGPKNNPDPKMSREMAKELAKDSGVLAILHSGNPVLAALVGGKALGNEAETALGNLSGQTVADAWGSDGMGWVGSGRGNDGTGDRTIGLGPLGTLGHGPGQPGGGYGKNPPAARLACKDCGKAPPKITLEQPVVINYDRELIRRVVRQHMNEVRFCYEQELTRDNSLNGRVVVKFSIGNMGSVTTSFVESSTLRSGNAAQCIANAVRRWEFQKPQGSLVIVSYPFVLKTAD